MLTSYQNTIKVGLLGAVALLGAAACTDDHFDVVVNEASSQNTVWQNIKAASDLDSVAMILERTKVLKSQTDGGKKQSYAQLLDQPQEFTAWLPKDGTYNAKYYLDLLDEADKLSESGVLADSLRALTIQYQVGTQFVRNHVARFSYGGFTNAANVRMLNGKVLNYVPGKSFNGANIDAQQSSIRSSNGTLHVIDAISPYAYNIYDFMVYDSRFSKLYDDVNKYNVYRFNASSSTEGAMNENGQMVYVDSVYARSNDVMTEASMYNIENEDSVFISMLPTNEIYEAAKARVSKLFKFANNYNYGWDTNSKSFTYKNSSAYKPNVDSLVAVKTLSYMLQCSSMSASNVNAAVMHDRNALLSSALLKDSIRLLNTYYIYNPQPGKSNPLFESPDAIVSNALTASNGYVVPLNKYELEPEDFMSPIYTELPYIMVNLTGSTIKDVTGFGSMLLEPSNWNDTIPLGGLLEDNYYYYFPVDGNSTMQIDLRLNGIRSGVPYKISLVTLPNNVNINNVRFQDGKPIVEAPQFDAIILDDKDKTLTQARAIKVDPNKAAKVTLFESYTFPYNYAELPSDYVSFPRLRLRVPANYQVRGKFKALSFGRLIVEPAK